MECHIIMTRYDFLKSGQVIMSNVRTDLIWHGIERGGVLSSDLHVLTQNLM